VKTQRMAAVSTMALAGVLALAACGSDNPTTGGTSSAAGGSGSSAAAGDCASGTLNGEGSSAQKNAVDEVSRTYQQKCSGAKVNYNPTGSGAGIKQFNAGQVDFAGSDSALKADEATAAEKQCKAPAWNLPMVTGPVAIGYNLEGVSKLVMTPAVLADIFSGKITTWNDPAIAAANKDAKLPATPIKVFFRSDESGTTENFTKYLKAAAPEKWTAEASKKWTGKGEGKEKSAGVATAVKSAPGGITYVEWSYAKDNKLGIAQVDNGGGPVELTGDNVGKAVAAAKQEGSGNDLKLKLDYATKEQGAYPILLVTYEVVCSKYPDATKGKNVKSFLKHFASADSQELIEQVGYAPLPKSISDKVATAIDAIS
jgi:phosphate transport system substrate-binding protein